MEPIPSIVLFLVGMALGILIGRYQRHAENHISELQERVKQSEPPPVQSRIIEPPLTPEEQALKEAEEQLAAINPQLSKD